MALVPFRVGFKAAGLATHNGGIIRAAFISSKAMRIENPHKPKPWPYKGTSNF